MPRFETLLVVLLGLLAAAGVVALLAVLRRRPASAAVAALARGELATALAVARTGTGAPREELMAAAIAAKHLLDLERARALLDRLLAADPGDGEAWLESGLAAAYSGDLDAAEAAFARAGALRADLSESLTLHRAWAALARGERETALRRFEEVEASLEGKLAADLAGDPLFAEWFLQAGALWQAAGREERAAWAIAAGRAAAPESRLPEVIVRGGGEPRSSPAATMGGP